MDDPVQKKPKKRGRKPKNISNPNLNTSKNNNKIVQTSSMNTWKYILFQLMVYKFEVLIKTR